MRLNKKHLRDFDEQGYLLVKGAFSPAEVRLMCGAFDRLAETARAFPCTTDHAGSRFVMNGSRIDRIVWCAGAEPVLSRLGADARLTAPAAALLGCGSMEQLICQAHFKMPGDGLRFRWHQDSEHRGYGTPDWNDVTGRGSFVQTVTAVDEMRRDNGPLMIVPGSAARGHIGLDRLEDPADGFDTRDLIPLTMEPGDALFMHPYAIHGSGPNDSDGPRRVFINGFAVPGANRRVYPGEGSGRILKV